MKKETQSPGYVIDLSRKLRKKLTAAEQILWENIKNKQLGFKFRNQHPVYRYILDFYCNEKKLAIEIDGSIHKTQKENDAYRDKYLASIGIETIRFTNEDIICNLTSVLEKISNRLGEL